MARHDWEQSTHLMCGQERGKNLRKEENVSERNDDDDEKEWQ